MKKLLILANPKSLNTKYILENGFVTKNYTTNIVNHFDILSILKNGIRTKHQFIDAHDIDAIWFEFDWDLERPSRNTQQFSKLLYTYYAEKFVYNVSALKLFHPFYDSKKFNSAFLEYHNFPHPRTYLLNDNEVNLDTVQFPKVLKKDISGRARGVELVMSARKLKNKQFGADDYILQDIVDVKEELRVVVHDYEMIGAVYKSTKFNNGRTSPVKVTGNAQNISNEVKDVSQNLARALEADVVGIDIVIDHNNKPWIIEFNIGAALGKFIEHTGVDLIESLFRKYES